MVADSDSWNVVARARKRALHIQRWTWLTFFAWIFLTRGANFPEMLLNTWFVITALLGAVGFVVMHVAFGRFRNVRCPICGDSFAKTVRIVEYQTECQHCGARIGSSIHAPGAERAKPELG